MRVDGWKVHGAAVVAVLASGVGAVIAGGGTSGVTLASPQALRLIQQAPAALASYPALQMTMDIHVSVNGHSVTETVSGISTPDGRTGDLTLQAGVGIAHPVRVLMVDGRMFAKNSAGQWLSCTVSTSTPQATPGADALTFLKLMPGATGQVQVLGHDTVDGVRTTHYRVMVDAEQAAQYAAAHQGTSLSPEQVQQLQQLGVTTIPVDAWLDGQNAMRQFEVHVSFGGSTVTMKTRIRGASTVPTVTAPPAAATTYVEPCQLMMQQALTG